MPLTTRVRVAVCLVRPLSRAIDWGPFAAVLVALVGLAVATGDDVRPFNLAATVRLAALLLGATAGFALVDAAATVTAAVPVPRWLRQWTRTLIAALVACAAWGLVFGVLAWRSAPGSDLGAPGYALEAVVCVGFGLACTAAVARRHGTDRSAAVIGSAVLLALAAGTLFYPGRVWPLPSEPDWDSVHTAWWFALPIPLVVLVLANREARRQRR
ncbi:hypothetical protein ABZ816_28760 [Actinosynnema sp. NPDC047251]|uniref:Uncharacterized protein n=1 Tax=Saccharothrix espanaensis (strain ATCC 51144 / DSM 44229 / JCM 9112 / NBRC 15066 / NRRL 15764) TaxID=1179773 RepID=K0JP86_SACES|nr:hypothetical protein [Saccharothrix espanaensis]CCH28380.1 hypothetical protein BN6_10520 [Saccharothrix espanaensis DSM 44229]